MVKPQTTTLVWVEDEGLCCSIHIQSTAAHCELCGCANAELEVIFVAQQDKDLHWVLYEVEINKL